ncbi:MAG: ATP-dependent DNA helicase RecG [Deltaproteobacteria bacterium]|nr:ATP-dependent DNA helicase RecG [Deltaproteobacteria bacterium]
MPKSRECPIDSLVHGCREPTPGAPVGELAQPLTVLPGIGPTLAHRLAERGLETLEDLAWMVPRGYDDMRVVVPLDQALSSADEEPAPERLTTCGTVRKVRYVRWGKRFLEVQLARGPAVLSVRWFQVHAGMANRFVIGHEVIVSGRLRRRGSAWEMANPDLLGHPDDAALDARLGIRPRYPLVEGVPGATLRRAMRHAVALASPHLVDGIPSEVTSRLSLPPLADALRGLNDPPADLGEDKAQALFRGESAWHRRLAFDELFFLSLAVLSRKASRREGSATPCLPHPGAREELAKAFPFSFTRAQELAIDELARDLAGPRPMNRLLQGDVGSGKTAVALAAAHLVRSAGRQVAIMAPTEILAEQHYRTIEPWAQSLGHRVALLTASTPRAVRESMVRTLAAGAVGIVVGTHALLAKDVDLADLGLVVIDEQHRFGVAQRVALRRKGLGTPHLLIMTATPIPRTLALTYYGDLDVTTLDELPPGRTPPETRVLRGDGGRKKAYEVVRRVVAAGRRAFVVCPLVAPREPDGGEPGGDGLPDWADATTTAERLARELAPARVGLVHGRMPMAERDAKMVGLRKGEIDVLVATTVIEVGVDIPEAQVMVVEDAGRFGLAQLHQLRGRVGRGGGSSYCLLVTRGTRGTAEGDDASRRLAIMEATSDGFRIAEEDLALRGPGEILGTRQAGLPRLRFGDLTRHATLAFEARREAEKLIDEDPSLSKPEHHVTAEVLRSRIGGAELHGAEGG